MKTNKTKIALIIVSVLLACALLAQCLYFAGVFRSKTNEKKTNEESEINTDEITYSLSHEGYTLEKVVILSRHNIRSPMSGSGSLLDTVTPYDWYNWSSEASELSLRGGALETIMGQYFRKWIEKEGLVTENYFPAENEFRIYANSKQRTIATAEYFTAGLLPVSNIDIENHVEFDKMDPVFTPQLTFISDEYIAAVKADIESRFSEKIKGLSDNYSLLSDVINLDESDAKKEGTLTGFSTDDLELKLELDAEPGMSGSLKTGCSISDALVLQYYEESDAKKAAFGHDLTDEQWKQISEIKDLYGDVLFTSPLVAPNVANPLLREIDSEMKNNDRIFSFLCGHDSNVGSVLASLEAEDYELPEAIESKTPIGCKLVFAKWANKSGENFWSVDLVYQSVKQLREISLLDLDHSPVVFSIKLSGIEVNADGLYPADKIENRFTDAIGQYDVLKDNYTLDKAA